MGDKDSRTEGPGLGTDESSESLGSLQSREEQGENYWEDRSTLGKGRLLTISDMDDKYRLSGRVQQSRKRKSISAPDLEDKLQLPDNMEIPLPHRIVERSNMGGTESSLAESGFLTEGSCWPTPYESLEMFDNKKEQSNMYEDLRMNSLPRRLLNRSNMGGTESSLKKSRSVTGGACLPSPDESLESFRKREEQDRDSDSPRRMPQEEQSFLGKSEEPESKDELEKSMPQEEQSFLGKSEEPESKDELEKSWYQRSVRTPLWLIVGSVVFIIFIIIIIIIIAVCLALSSQGAVKAPGSCGPPCEESWIWVGGRCYFFSDTAKTWNDSRDFCTGHNSMLAVLIDQEIQKTITRYRENVNYWIGLSMDHNGQWMWSNGSLYNGSVTNQNDNHLRCAFLNSHPGALDCSTGRQWICVQDSS